MGHFSNVFCSFCVFPRSMRTPGYSILYTSKMHSPRMCLVRFDTRVDIVRITGVISKAFRKQVGVKSNSRELAAAYYTDKLSLELFRRMDDRISRTSNDILAKERHFDSFLSPVPGPGHLITGLIKDDFQLCFTSLDTDWDRKRAYSSIWYYIPNYNLPRTDGVLQCLRWNDTTAKRRTSK